MSAIFKKLFSFKRVTSCAFIVGFCSYYFNFESRFVRGTSMYPTLENKEGIQILLTGPRGIKVNDVVIFRSAEDPEKFCVKRVKALEGEVIPNKEKGKDTFIPKGHCWVEGDNTNCSRDSRNYGPIPLGLIVGKALFVYWPLQNVRMIRNDNIEDQKHKEECEI